MDNQQRTSRKRYAIAGVLGASVALVVGYMVDARGASGGASMGNWIGEAINLDAMTFWETFGSSAQWAILGALITVLALAIVPKR